MAAALPTDVLRILFAPLALRHRLRIAARVCRRWRTAAYLTVTAIEPPLVYTGPLDLYPNLTAFTLVGERSIPATWPPEQLTRIRELHIPVMAGYAALAAAKSLTSLTSLDARDTHWLVSRHAIPIVRASAASLTHLSLPANGESPQEHEKVPALPALRSLSVRGYAGDLIPLLSQITSLTAPRLHQLARGGALASLRCLQLELPLAASEIHVLRSLSLTALGVEVEECGVEDADLGAFLAALCTALTSLTLPLASLDATAADSLRMCTNLTSVYNSNFDSLGVQHLAPLPTLQSLTLRFYTEPDLGALTCLTSLTALTIYTERPIAVDALQQMRLPRLRELAAYESPHSPDWITDVLGTFTMLHTLRLSVTAKSPLNRAAFEAALEAADRRGMAIVDFGQLRQPTCTALTSDG